MVVLEAGAGAVAGMRAGCCRQDVKNPPAQFTQMKTIAATGVHCAGLRMTRTQLEQRRGPKICAALEDNEPHVEIPKHPAADPGMKMAASLYAYDMGAMTYRTMTALPAGMFTMR